ncbi:MAG: bifunctional precorrin-2 dehydrogenase/sirohydrochlorin ferrochelatase [Candidatus Xenobiia bacterium LiM19]
MPLYQVSLCIAGRLCVVIGAGDVAERKIESLLQAGAEVRVIAPDNVMIDGVEFIRRQYKAGDLQGAFLAIAATDDRETNEAVYKEALERNVLVNVVDNPSLCTFFVPSVLTRGDLQISISTGGKCPALAKKMRIDMESRYGTEFDEYLKIVEEARHEILAGFMEEDRREIMNRVLEDAPLFEMVRENRLEEARERVRHLLCCDKESNLELEQPGCGSSRFLNDKGDE